VTSHRTPSLAPLQGSQIFFKRESWGGALRALPQAISFHAFSVKNPAANADCAHPHLECAGRAKRRRRFGSSCARFPAESKAVSATAVQEPARNRSRFCTDHAILPLRYPSLMLLSMWPSVQTAPSVLAHYALFEMCS
jgi:hypothetical protein